MHTVLCPFVRRSCVCMSLTLKDSVAERIGSEKHRGTRALLLANSQIEHVFEDMAQPMDGGGYCYSHRKECTVSLGLEDLFLLSLVYLFLFICCVCLSKMTTSTYPGLFVQNYSSSNQNTPVFLYINCSMERCLKPKRDVCTAP